MNMNKYYMKHGLAVDERLFNGIAEVIGSNSSRTGLMRLSNPVEAWICFEVFSQQSVESIFFFIVYSYFLLVIHIVFHYHLCKLRTVNSIY